jgi:quercetin dioxygenase-like cupin family protein
MTPNGKDTHAEESAALLAAGALPPHEAAEAEALPGAWAFSAVAAMLADAFPSVDPPPAVKDKILSQVAQRTESRSSDRAAAATLPEIFFQFAGDAEFVRTAYPQLFIRLLHVDHLRGQFSAFIRLEPGGRFPEHSHDGPEECLVLEGELLVGGVRMKAGDFQRVESGSKHVEQHSPSGALLFLTAPLGLLSL